MATRRNKRVVVTAKNDNVSEPKAKRGRKAVIEAEPEVKTPKNKPVKRLGMRAAPTRTTPPRKVKATQDDAKPAPARRGRKPKKKSEQKEEALLQDGQDVDAIEDESPELPATASQKFSAVKKKILNLLTDSKRQEKYLMNEEELLKQSLSVEDDMEYDSDDALSEGGKQAMADLSHNTMDDAENYVKHPFLDGLDESDHEVEEEVEDNVDEDDEVEEESEEKTLDVSGLHLIPDEKKLFDDKGKSYFDWWSEDPTRESTLCVLWRDEHSLYDSQDPAHRVSTNRASILKKFSVFLQMPPHIIFTRMTSLRSQYQKLAKASPSGSEGPDRTDRQEEILRLCNFLKDHVKITESLTSYRGKSPGTGQVKARRTLILPKKYSPSDYSTPVPKKSGKSAGRGKGSAAVKSLDPSLSPIVGQKPIKQEVVDSGDGESVANSESEEFPVILTNNKHFSRNTRLLDPRSLSISKERSPRLSDIVDKTRPALSKKEVNKSKFKSSANAPRREDGEMIPKVIGTITYNKNAGTSGKTVTKATRPQKYTTQEETDLERLKKMWADDEDDFRQTPAQKSTKKQMPSQVVGKAIATKESKKAPLSKVVDKTNTTKVVKNRTSTQDISQSQSSKPITKKKGKQIPVTQSMNKSDSDVSHFSLPDVSLESTPKSKLSAKERYLLAFGNENKRNVLVVPDKQAKETVVKKVKAVRGLSLKKNQPGRAGQKIPAYVRKVEQASTSKECTEVIDLSSDNESDRYDVSVEPSWYEKQGSAYRKHKEELIKKKKENDPMVKIMKERTDLMKKMQLNNAKNDEKITSILQAGLQAPNPTVPAVPVGKVETAEELWAKCLVPHMMRMNQDIRDQFMGHCLNLAFKAIRGLWPTDDER